MKTTRTRGLRLAVLAAIAATALGAPGAQAEPFAGQVRTATGQLHILGSDKVHYAVTVTLQAVQPAGATSPALSLQVAVATCRHGECGRATSYLVPVGATGGGQIAEDLSIADVTTRFAGRPLWLRWTADAAGPSASVAGGVDGTTVWAGEPRGGAGGVHGSILGLTCGGDGVLNGRVVLDPDGAPALHGARPPSRLPAAFAKSGRRGPSCLDS